MRDTKIFFLFITGLSLVLFGCTSAATKQSIQGNYENALRLFNKLPDNAKECAPMEYAKAEATLAHVEEEISEEHWRFARKYMPMADEQVRDARSAVKRRCKKKIVKEIAPPPPPPPPTSGQPTFILEGITFDFDKATIRSSSEPTLKEAGMVMQRFKSVKVRIEGHTDSVGADDYNQNLSELRAFSVKGYLGRGFDLDQDRIGAIGFGEKKPVADNQTEEGRAQNRRIEFVVTDQ